MSTPSQKAIALLKQQWALTLADEIKDLVSGLPEGHQERPGLIRAIEFVRHYGLEVKLRDQSSPPGHGQDEYHDEHQPDPGAESQSTDDGQDDQDDEEHE